jgi:hypothetical protein
MFQGLKISTINPLKNWNVSNGKQFNYMFSNCQQLVDIKALKNWNISNGTDFGGLFSQRWFQGGLCQALGCPDNFFSKLAKRLREWKKKCIFAAEIERYGCKRSSN